MLTGRVSVSPSLGTLGKDTGGREDVCGEKERGLGGKLSTLKTKKALEAHKMVENLGVSS